MYGPGLAPMTVTAERSASSTRDPVTSFIRPQNTQFSSEAPFSPGLVCCNCLFHGGYAAPLEQGRLAHGIPVWDSPARLAQANAVGRPLQRAPRDAALSALCAQWRDRDSGIAWSSAPSGVVEAFSSSASPNHSAMCVRARASAKPE